MKTTTISSESADTIVTKTTNTVNVFTPILKVLVPDGASYTIPNLTTVGNVVINGAIFLVDLRNSAGDRLRGEILVSYEESNGEFPRPLRKMPLTIWGDLTTAEQKSAQFRGTIAQASDLNCGPFLELRGKAKFYVSLNSAEQVDWTKSYFEVMVEEKN